jgi:hypothetical protein
MLQTKLQTEECAERFGSIDQVLSFYQMKISPIGRSCPSCLRKTGLRFAVGAIVSLSLQACAVIAVADAAVTVVATGVKVTAKAVGAVASAVIPGAD